MNKYIKQLALQMNKVALGQEVICPSCNNNLSYEIELHEGNDRGTIYYRCSSCGFNVHMSRIPKEKLGVNQFGHVA